LEHLQKIHRRKTGALLVGSLRLGALTAQASTEQFESLSTYGEKLGLAFQIVDDLLDLNGDSTTLGKNPGQDTTHGKLTFPALLGEQDSRQRAEELIRQAVNSLSGFGDTAEPLRSLAWYVLDRNH
jgi:geranylgeranyl diphosphate synthase type II